MGVSVRLHFDCVDTPAKTSTSASMGLKRPCSASGNLTAGIREWHLGSAGRSSRGSLILLAFSLAAIQSLHTRRTVTSPKHLDLSCLPTVKLYLVTALVSPLLTERSHLAARSGTHKELNVKMCSSRPRGPCCNPPCGRGVGAVASTGEATRYPGAVVRGAILGTICSCPSILGELSCALLPVVHLVCRNAVPRAVIRYPSETLIAS